MPWSENMLDGTPKMTIEKTMTLKDIPTLTIILLLLDSANHNLRRPQARV
ncbi:hypothetical protein [Rubritalea tangerina]